MKTRALFVCARNRWRSPTAERIFARDPNLDVRARGLSPRSPRRLSARDVAWADVIFVMEHAHRTRLRQAFGQGQPIVAPIEVLDIPDEYEFMDPELVELLEERVGEFLAERDD